jgi:hypothetical protein
MAKITPVWWNRNKHAECCVECGNRLGKAAWLCGGSIAGKLIAKGWVYSDSFGTRSGTRYVYKITEKERIYLETLKLYS